jgi:hypothetical protein
MILGVNGIRLVGRRSGVGRAIEAFLTCLGEMDQYFDDIRVYSPQPLDSTVHSRRLRSVVLPSSCLPACGSSCPAEHMAQHVLFCPS